MIPKKKRLSAAAERVVSELAKYVPKAKTLVIFRDGALAEINGNVSFAFRSPRRRSGRSLRTFCRSLKLSTSMSASLSY